MKVIVKNFLVLSSIITSLSLSAAEAKPTLPKSWYTIDDHGISLSSIIDDKGSRTELSVKKKFDGTYDGSMIISSIKARNGIYGYDSLAMVIKGHEESFFNDMLAALSPESKEIIAKKIKAESKSKS